MVDYSADYIAQMFNNLKNLTEIEKLLQLQLQTFALYTHHHHSNAH